MAHYVLVHGAFAGPWYWGPVSELLEAAGHTVRAVALPSCGTDPAALGGLPDDVAAVRAAVADTPAAEPGCVLVAHSWGGVVVTELADHPRVAHTVYVSAFWPRRGQTVQELLGAEPPGWAVLRPDGALEVVPDGTVAREALANDLDPDAAAAMLARLVLFSAAGFATVSSAPDRRHPTTFVVCDLDHAVPPPVQERMAAQADRVVHLATSHQPMLARPAELAAVLASAAPAPR